MKKILFLLLVCLPCIVNAQLNVQTHSEASGYIPVCDIKAHFGVIVGEIRFIHNVGYVLCGVTDNQFEETMATIVLGKNKTEACQSLKDLRNIVLNYEAGTYVVKGIQDRTTKIIIPSTKLLAAVIETEYVAGQSAVPYWLCYNDNRYNRYYAELVQFDERQKNPFSEYTLVPKRQY